MHNSSTLATQEELVSCTQTKGRYLTRVYHYGDEAEAVTVFRPSFVARERRERGQGDREASAQRCAARARTQVRRHVMAHGLDHMVTFTFRENVQDIDDAWRAWDKFRRLVEARTGKKLHYVVVPERQKRGAWHFHVAVRGFVPVALWRALWRRCTPDGQGTVHARYLRAVSRIGIVRYLAKYLTKAFGERDQLNRRRYAIARGMHVVPALERMSSAVDDCVQALRELFGEPSYVVQPAQGVTWCCTW